ncbi:hydroxyacylglutathione hydrolase [Paraferrimonas sp. SM1919]|uniref:hydroxyacylglutathione hydrolase n=1 Tax=Paraferrimonas sp. SM1919 TaxID=2662263 RepID=UPI0013D84D9F|nr:hydroxyacylglutathione hydrolase [Paraferrimonas sp. SM1919]
MLTPIPIRAFDDNYIWCIKDKKQALVVDPGCADSVIAYLQANDLQLAAILVTHHHQDHTGGIEALIAFYGAIPVYGPANRIDTINIKIHSEQTIKLSPFELEAKIYFCPGHTLDHIAYHIDDMLFCGDSLFSAGCGRLFEGDAAMAYASLQKFAQLSDKTRVFPTHEYTLANIDFALSVEPDNLDLHEHKQKCLELIARGQATLPTSIETEKKINPFLRCEQPEIINSANLATNKAIDSVTVFSKIRSLKDHF